MFQIDTRLETDTFPLTDLALCRVLLMNNALFPWLILVPRVEGARELSDLSAAERHTLMDEIAEASAVLQQLLAPHKLNVAALGNQVAQLHVHVIARYAGDAAWPAPVWGKAIEPYPNPLPHIIRLAAAFAPVRTREE